MAHDAVPDLERLMVTIKANVIVKAVSGYVVSRSCIVNRVDNRT